MGMSVTPAVVPGMASENRLPSSFFLIVYVEEGVTIRRIKPRQASESSVEENVIRRRRKKKTRHMSEGDGQRLKNVTKKKVETSSNEGDDVISSQGDDNEENNITDGKKDHYSEIEPKDENGDATKQKNGNFEHHSQIVTAIVHNEPQSGKTRVLENETLNGVKKSGEEDKTIEGELVASQYISAVADTENKAFDEMEVANSVEQILEKEITESHSEKRKIEENFNDQAKQEYSCEIHDKYVAEESLIEQHEKCDEGENGEEKCTEIKLETDISAIKEEILHEKFESEDKEHSAANVEQKTEIETCESNIHKEKEGEQETREGSQMRGENGALEESENLGDSGLDDYARETAENGALEESRNAGGSGVNDYTRETAENDALEESENKGGGGLDDYARETAELAKTESKKLSSEISEGIVAKKIVENGLEGVENEVKVCENADNDENIVNILSDKGLVKVLNDNIPRKVEGKRRSRSIEKKSRKDTRTESFELLRSTQRPSENEELASGGESQMDTRASPGLESNLHDSGIEPSPKREKQKGRGPRSSSVSRSRIPRACRKGRAFELQDEMPSTVSITQAVQYSVRKYHLERRIFHQLLELKRLQIRAGRASEGVLVKRLVDDYRRAGLMIGLQQYNGVYTFRAFEKYLYEQLRLLQSSEKRIIPRLRSSDDLERLTSALRKSKVGQDILTMVPTNPALCSYQTHRCYHAIHAYTGIPCAAYLAGRNHHTMPKPGSFLPKIVQGDNHHGVAKTLRFVDPTRPLTLELSHGSEKQVITLPTEKLDKSKRYFVTFTIKSGSSKKTEGQHVHATSV